MMINLPAHKSDLEAVDKIISLNPLDCVDSAERVLEWCYDPNWPVAEKLSIWLAQMGRHLLPAVEKLDKTNDDNAKYSVIVYVIALVSKNERSFFLPLLKRWSASPTAAEKKEEVDLAAQDVLTLWAAP